jgi:exonuclease III
MVALSWNIRGLGRIEKRRVVRNLVSSLKPILIFIQETKLNSFDSKVIKSLGGSLLTKGVGLDANGSAGGLIVNEDLFEVKACISNDRCIILVGLIIKLRREVVFCNVYAANNENERVELWNYIYVKRKFCYQVLGS